MEIVEEFESIKVNRCTVFSVLQRLIFDFMIDRMFRKVMTLVGEVVHKIAQNCENLIYGESQRVRKHQSEALYFI